MIGYDIAAALPELRAQAESLMVDRCNIDRQNGTTWDEAEQASVPVWESVAADVPCTLLPPGGGSRSLVTGETATQETRTIRIPLSVEGVQEDDQVTVAGVGVLWVSHVPVRSHMTSARLECRWVR